MAQELTIGTRIDHDRYGEGVISKVKTASYEVFFARGGKMEFSRSATDYEVLEMPDGVAQPADTASYEAAVQLISDVLEKFNSHHGLVPMGDKWSGGKLIIRPSNPSLQAKEIPVEQFFHKIVMLRDRLRVMEQNINSHPKLSDEDKVNLQQYITRIYGSLTTFNLLFADKKNYFVGAGSRDEE